MAKGMRYLANVALTWWRKKKYMSGGVQSNAPNFAHSLRHCAKNVSFQACDASKAGISMSFTSIIGYGYGRTFDPCVKKPKKRIA
jgi:hypothetical protein